MHTATIHMPVRPRPRRAAPRAPAASYRAAAAGLVGLSVAAHLVYLFAGCPLDLAPDEAHYWHWSRHPDWSYYSKGPLVAWLVRASCEAFGGLSVWLTGTEMAAVRLPAVACHAAVLAGWYALAADTLRSPRLGFLTVAAALTLPPVTAGAVVMTIDPPFLACWCWALVAVWRALTRNSLRWWAAAGAFTAVGVTAKYPMLLLPAAVGVYLAATPDRRIQLKRPGFWLMAGMAAGGCLPMIAWNLANDWVGVRHVFGQAGVGYTAKPPGFHPLGPLAFAAGQFGFLLGFWFVAMVAAGWVFRPRAPDQADTTRWYHFEGRGTGPIWFVKVVAAGFRQLYQSPTFRPPLRKGGETVARNRPVEKWWKVVAPGVRFLWFLSLPVWAVFGVASFRTAGQVNWPAAAYVAGLPLAVLWVRNQLEHPHRRWVKVSLGSAVAAGLGLSLAAHFPGLVRPGVATLAGPPTAANPTPVRRFDPTCRLQGWRTLAATVDAARDRVRRETGQEALIAGMIWTVPGELSFYCDGHPEAYSFGLALADRHSQYDLWRPNPVADAQAFRGRSFVYVGDEIPGMAKVFDRVEPPVRVTHTANGQPVAVWTVWVAHGFRGFPDRRLHAIGAGY